MALKVSSIAAENKKPLAQARGFFAFDEKNCRHSRTRAGDVENPETLL
jgi:hypothetical protein